MAVTNNSPPVTWPSYLRFFPQTSGELSGLALPFPRPLHQFGPQLISRIGAGIAMVGARITGKVSPSKSLGLWWTQFPGSGIAADQLSTKRFLSWCRDQPFGMRIVQCRWCRADAVS